VHRRDDLAQLRQQMLQLTQQVANLSIQLQQPQQQRNQPWQKDDVFLAVVEFDENDEESIESSFCVDQIQYDEDAVNFDVLPIYDDYPDEGEAKLVFNDHGDLPIFDDKVEDYEEEVVFSDQRDVLDVRQLYFTPQIAEDDGSIHMVLMASNELSLEQNLSNSSNFMLSHDEDSSIRFDLVLHDFFAFPNEVKVCLEQAQHIHGIVDNFRSKVAADKRDVFLDGFKIRGRVFSNKRSMTTCAMELVFLILKFEDEFSPTRGE
jgi:hypothetical protein